MMASRILLFPDPFGPVTAINPFWKFKEIFFEPNDLKPKTSNFLI
jgi:hypothetical protein